MYQVRKSVFETNSSSVHTICIAKGDVPRDVIQSDYFYFRLGQFSWGIEDLHEREDRFSYLYEAVVENSNGTDYMNKFKKMLEDCGIFYELEPVDDTKDHYIDHASYLTEFLDEILSNKDMFLRFLFNDKSYLHISNDNETDYNRYPEKEADFDIFVKWN